VDFLLSGYSLILPALDSNDIGYSEEGGLGEYQEEDQEHTTEQGKPSKFIHVSILVSLCACFIII
jgi:hypothetical protein